MLNSSRSILKPVSSALKVTRLNKCVAKTVFPTWSYRLTYTDKIPGQPELKHTIVCHNIEHVREFMECMMRVNYSIVQDLAKEYHAVCSCSNECSCSCWQDNIVVYNLYGDIVRPIPKVSQLLCHLEEDDVGVIYRVGHSPALDDIRPNKPRFQFEVERYVM
jgi:hypothetical protein